MGILVYILGRSGTGKSYSMHNFPKDKLAVINVQGKILPFKGSAGIEQTATDISADILKALDIYAHDYKSIVVDDYQYVMSNEFMRRSTESTWDKFTDIARHAWDVVTKVRELPDDVIVYVMCHTDADQDGNEKLKTIGKLLDEKICLEGLSTIVLKTNVSDGQYSFLTQNNGKDTVKSPAGMFPTYAISNDLYYVDQKIRNYYEMAGHVSDEEIAAADQAVAKPDLTKEAAAGKRKRRSAASTAASTGSTETVETVEQKADRMQKEAEQAVADALAEPAKEHTKRRRKTSNVASTTLYFEHAGQGVLIINKGDVIPNPADGYKEISKEEYDARIATAEKPAGKKRRRKTKEEREDQKAIAEGIDGFMNIPDDIDDDELPFN